MLTIRKEEKKKEISSTDFLTVPNAVTQTCQGKLTRLSRTGTQLSMPTTCWAQTAQGSQNAARLKEVQYQSISGGTFKMKFPP